MADVQKVTIPYKPRNWARLFHQSTARFAALILHRRAGKTTCVINHHQKAAMSDAWERQRLLTLKPDLTPAQLEELVHPPGGRHYGHIMPARNQAKLVVWDKVKFYARGIPGVKYNESELLVRYPTGHKFQLFGADNPDSLRGPMFSGVSFDEYSQQPRNIFTEVVSKALGDHLGWAVFVGTIKGKDHLFNTWDAARKDPSLWFALWQDVDRSLQTEDGITIQLLQQAMADDQKLIASNPPLMTLEEFEQEWYLSTDAAIKGQWFEKELRAVKAQKRIRPVPVDPMLPVHTGWDLGMNDAMAIWCYQKTRSGELRFVDYYENTGEGLQHYAKVLQDKGYVYGDHWAPHDIMVREIGTGKSRYEVGHALGIRFKVAPKLSFEDGLNAARLLLARCYFDEGATAAGVNALRNYKKRYNESLKEFTGTPVHDWASHGADALRTVAAADQPEKPVETDDDDRAYTPRSTWG